MSLAGCSLSAHFSCTRRSKIVIASLVVVFLAVGAWITMGEMVFALHQRILLDAEGEPVATSVLGPPINICPVAPVCPPLPTCPEPFPIERTSEYIFPVKNAQSESPWVAENHRQLRALFQCLENRDCGRNQATGWPPLYIYSLFSLTKGISRHIGLISLPGSPHGLEWRRRYLVSCFSLLLPKS